MGSRADLCTVRAFHIYTHRVSVPCLLSDYMLFVLFFAALLLCIDVKLIHQFLCVLCRQPNSDSLNVFKRWPTSPLMMKWIETSLEARNLAPAF